MIVVQLSVASIRQLMRRTRAVVNVQRQRAQKNTQKKPTVMEMKLRLNIRQYELSAMGLSRSMGLFNVGGTMACVRIPQLMHFTSSFISVNSG